MTYDKFHIVIQIAASGVNVPSNEKLRKWAREALRQKINSAEVTIRIVDEKEMAELNSVYRHKTGTTNVLSFPFITQEKVEIEIPILGDIVICAEVVNREAKEQDKSLESHWAHMIVHSVLHLLGYDHEQEEDALMMENLEKDILQKLGFKNPYLGDFKDIHE